MNKFKKSLSYSIGLILFAAVGVGVGNAGPQGIEPVSVEVTNTTSNPVPVVGNTSVSNFPATQDVSVTNTSSNPVPVTMRRSSDSGRMTLNTRTFIVPAGEEEVFGPENFQPIQVSFITASGLDENVEVYFRGESNNGKLLLYGNKGSGIGQEDYVFSLPEPIYVESIVVNCLETSGSCKLFVQIVGRF
jgi:hypothetical protein